MFKKLMSFVIALLLIGSANLFSMASKVEAAQKSSKYTKSFDDLAAAADDKVRQALIAKRGLPFSLADYKAWKSGQQGEAEISGEQRFVREEVASKPVPVPKPGPKPAPTPKKVVTEAQKAQLISEINDIGQKVYKLVMSQETQEDARTLLADLNKRFEAARTAINLEIEKGIASLPKKEVQAKRALTDADKQTLLELRKTWSGATVYPNYMNYLETHNIMFDDAFLNQLWKSPEEK